MLASNAIKMLKKFAEVSQEEFWGGEFTVYTGIFPGGNKVDFSVDPDESHIRDPRFRYSYHRDGRIVMGDDCMPNLASAVCAAMKQHLLLPGNVSIRVYGVRSGASVKRIVSTFINRRELVGSDPVMLSLDEGAIADGSANPLLDWIEDNCIAECDTTILTP